MEISPWEQKFGWSFSRFILKQFTGEQNIGSSFSFKNVVVLATNSYLTVISIPNFHSQLLNCLRNKITTAWHGFVVWLVCPIKQASSPCLQVQLNLSSRETNLLRKGASQNWKKTRGEKMREVTMHQVVLTKFQHWQKPKELHKVKPVQYITEMGGYLSMIFVVATPPY